MPPDIYFNKLMALNDGVLETSDLDEVLIQASDLQSGELDKEFYPQVTRFLKEAKFCWTPPVQRIFLDEAQQGTIDKKLVEGIPVCGSRASTEGPSPKAQTTADWERERALGATTPPPTTPLVTPGQPDVTQQAPPVKKEPTPTEGDTPPPPAGEAKACTPPNCAAFPLKLLNLRPSMLTGKLDTTITERGGDNLPQQNAVGFFPFDPLHVAQMVTNFKAAHFWVPAKVHDSKVVFDSGWRREGSKRVREAVHYVRITSMINETLPVPTQFQVSHKITDYGDGSYYDEWHTVPITNLFPDWPVLSEDSGYFEIGPVVENNKVIGTYVAYELAIDPADKSNPLWGQVRAVSKRASPKELKKLYNLIYRSLAASKPILNTEFDGRMRNEEGKFKGYELRIHFR